MAAAVQRRLRPASWLLGAALAAHLVHTLAGVGPRGAASTVLYDAIIVLSALLCAARWAAVPAERRAWGLLTAAVMAWAGGELYHSLFLASMDITPFPSPSDVFFVAFYPLCFAGMAALVHDRVAKLGLALGLDALIAALAVAAVAAAVTFDSVLVTLTDGSGPLATTFNLAYPAGDLILLGAVARAFAATGWRPDRTLSVLGAALLLVAVGDSAYLVQAVHGTYVEDGWVDATWPAGMALVAWAATQPARPIAVRMTGWQSVVFPFSLSLTAVGVLVARELGPVNHVATSLALAAVLAVITRMLWALRDNAGLLAAARQEARTDPLTGLGNRRALELDLRRVLAGGDETHVLVLFDLDGFKAYNDTYGHPAGDALLARRGRALRAAVGGRGRAYRPGGDEFCVLLPGTREQAGPAVRDCVAALRERGAGHGVGPSWGVCAVPLEASATADALRLADERMYAHKAARRDRPAGVAPAAVAA